MSGEWLALSAVAALAVAAGAAKRRGLGARNIENTLSEWVYHATSSARLSEIALYGLESADPGALDSEGSDLEQPAGVYFAPIPRLALQWNDVLLRFPWPDDYEADPYVGSLLIGDDVVPGAFYTEQGVSPEKIEVWGDGKWRPITRTAP